MKIVIMFVCRPNPEGERSCIYIMINNGNEVKPYKSVQSIEKKAVPHALSGKMNGSWFIWCFYRIYVIFGELFWTSRWAWNAF